jgi:hypothetical protein
MEETLQQSKSRLESEQARIIEQIQAVRHEARDYSLRCQATREPQDQKESERRRGRIAELQSSLMSVQAELGQINRNLRSQKPAQLAEARARARRELEEKRNDFLEAFWQIARDSLDPRQFRALESGARAFLRKAHEMGIEEPAVRSG